MDEIAEYCDRVILLHDGVLLSDATPTELFYGEDVEKYGLSLPHVVKIVKLLRDKGVVIPEVLNEKDLVKELKLYLERGRKNA